MAQALAILTHGKYTGLVSLQHRNVGCLDTYSQENCTQQHVTEQEAGKAFINALKNSRANQWSIGLIHYGAPNIG